jgi:beta-phosphoglucomutase-like phosphatase (HAD superfamily)
MAKRELEALLFDVDGTLAETERDGHRVAFNLAFAKLGLGWVWDPALYNELLKVAGGKERLEAWLSRLPPGEVPQGDRGELIAKIHRAKTRHFVALVGAVGLPLRPGAERLLREARGAGLRLAIATTTTPANVVALLCSALGPESIGWVEVIAAGDVVQAKRPAPDIYRYALERSSCRPRPASPSRTPRTASPLRAPRGLRCWSPAVCTALTRTCATRAWCSATSASRGSRARC